jgi:hypothetical protein
MVFDVALTWEKLQHHKQNGTVDQSMYKQEDLLAIMEKAKGGVKKDGNKSKK